MYRQTRHGFLTMVEIRRALCLGAAALLVGCGGMVDDGQGGGPGLELRGEAGDTLQASKQNGFLVVTAPGRDVPVLWANLASGDVIVFAWQGQRYTYEETGSSQALDLSPEGGSGDMVAGGRIAAGGRVGFPDQVEVDGASVPHVLEVNGADAGADTVEYAFSRCSDATCTSGPISPSTQTVANGTWDNLSGALKIHGRAISADLALIAVVRESTTNATGSTTGGNGYGSTGTGSTAGTTTGSEGGQTVKKDDDNDWWKIALGVVAGVAVGWIIGDIVSGWGSKDDSVPEGQSCSDCKGRSGTMKNGHCVADTAEDGWLSTECSDAEDDVSALAALSSSDASPAKPVVVKLDTCEAECIEQTTETHLDTQGKERRFTDYDAKNTCMRHLCEEF